MGTFYTLHRQVKLEESSPKRMDPSLPSIITVLSMPSFDVRANIYYNVPVDHPPSQVAI